MRERSADAGAVAAAVSLALILGCSAATTWTRAWSIILPPAAAVFALTAICALAWFIRGSWPARNWMLVPVALAPVCGLAQLTFSTTADRFITAATTLQFASVACAFAVAVYAFASVGALRTFRVLVVVFGTALSVVAILQLATGNDKAYWIIDLPPRAAAMGPFVNRDNYSTFIAMVLPLALWEAVRNTRSAWLFGIPAAIMFSSVVAGLSRAGSALVCLEAAAVLVPAVLAARHIGAGRIARAVTAGILIVLFSSFVGWAELLARFDEKDPYGQSRRDLVQTCVLMIRDRPVEGFGLGSWPFVHSRYIVRDEGIFTRQAHNDWLEWACNGGLPFVILLLIPALHAGWLALTRYPWAVGVIAASVHALVDFPFDLYPNLLLFFLIIAAVETHHRKGARGA